jgi:osmotically-inducible protein OsmY
MYQPFKGLFNDKEHMMRTTKYILSVAMAALIGVAGTGCAVMRDQQSVGAYVDDAGITAAVKARFVDDKSVDAAAISVETLNGTVQLSGFAKTEKEKSQAEMLAREVKGVKSVRNGIIVRS